jgi:hypothetical protein
MSARALHVSGADGCLVQTVDRVYSVETTRIRRPIDAEKVKRYVDAVRSVQERS